MSDMTETERIQAALFDAFSATLPECVQVLQAFQDVVPQPPTILIGAPDFTPEGRDFFSSEKSSVDAATSIVRSTATCRVQLWELGSYGDNMRKALRFLETEEGSAILEPYGLSSLSSDPIQPTPRSEDRHYIPECTSYIRLMISTVDTFAQTGILQTSVTRTP